MTLPFQNLVEISFEQLTKNPVESVKRIYNRFGWKNSGFSDTFDCLPENKYDASSYAAIIHKNSMALKTYKKNDFSSAKLDKALLDEIQSRWGHISKRHGYLF